MSKIGILKQLESRPTLILESNSNPTCIELFTDLGLIHQFKQSTTPHFSSLFWPEHHTHWIIGGCWSGHAGQNANGYTAYCLPKRNFTLAQAKGFADMLLKTVGGEIYEQHQIVIPAEPGSIHYAQNQKTNQIHKTESQTGTQDGG